MCNHCGTTTYAGYYTIFYEDSLNKRIIENTCDDFFYDLSCCYGCGNKFYLAPYLEEKLPESSDNPDQYTLNSDLCPKCFKYHKLDLHTFSCPVCGNIFNLHSHESEFDEHGVLQKVSIGVVSHYVEEVDLEVCTACADTVTRCSQCRSVVDRKNHIQGYGCTMCRDFSSAIQNWRYKDYVRKIRRVPGELVKNTRSFGFEFEVKLPHECNREVVAQRLLNELGDEAFCVEDGSLGYGVEIVARPMSIEYFKTKSTFRNLWDLLDEFAPGWRDLTLTGKCGLHVHVGRHTISRLTQLKILNFCYMNPGLMAAIGRRQPNQYCKYIADLRFTNSVLCRPSRNHRYTAVNMSNSRTIEFRIFRSALEYDHVLEAVEFINALIAFLKDRPVNKIHIESLDAFVKRYRKEYPNLFYRLYQSQDESPLTQSHCDYYTARNVGLLPRILNKEV